MKQICKSCKTELSLAQGQSSPRNITGGLCRSCALKLSDKGNALKNRDVLDAIDAPVLLMQPDPRQVFMANNKALELFEKGLRQVEGHRGGQVFDCIHSFTEAGCGKDANCENCKIKSAIVDTFTTGNSFEGVSTPLEIRKTDNINTYVLRVSTEKVGDLALLRIDQYRKA
jgi:hypothetical protein